MMKDVRCSVRSDVTVFHNPHRDSMADYDLNHRLIKHLCPVMGRQFSTQDTEGSLYKY